MHTHTANAYDGSGDVTTPNGAVWAERAIGRVGHPLYSTPRRTC